MLTWPTEITKLFSCYAYNLIFHSSSDVPQCRLNQIFPSFCPPADPHHSCSTFVKWVSTPSDIGLTNFYVRYVYWGFTDIQKLHNAFSLLLQHEYPLGWVNNSFYTVWGIIGIISVCPYKAKLLKIQNNRPRAHLPVNSGTAGCSYAGIRRVRNEYVTQIACGVRTPLLPTVCLVKMTRRVGLTKFYTRQVDLTNFPSNLNVGLTNFSACQVGLTNFSPNLNLDLTKISSC